MSVKEKEPAKKNYFFGGSYEDLWGTIKRAYQMNFGTIKKRMDNISDAFSYGGIVKKVLSFVMNMISVLVVLFLGTAYTVCFSLIHVAIVFAIMLVFYVLFSIVWSIDRLYLVINKIRHECPVCYKRFLIPAFRCSCGSIHKRLVPGKYGTLKHKCECGNKLPATFFNGRSKLNALCPFCKSNIAASEIRTITYQLIGGSSSGKTVYLSALFHELLKKVNDVAGIGYEITDEYKPYFELLERYYSGEECDRTRQLNAQMYPVLMDIGHGVKRQLSIYDIAGEMFGSDVIYSQEVHNQFQYCEGLLLVIDPFSSEQVRRDKDNTVDMSEISNVSANVVVTNFVNYFISLKHVNARKVSDKKVAILISKSDIKEAKREIGPAKIRSIYSKEPDKYTSYEDCRDQVCRQYLINMGFVSAIDILEMHFNNIKYFPVSAMGHSQDGTEYASWGIMEPLKWMLPDADREFAKSLGME